MTEIEIAKGKQGHLMNKLRDLRRHTKKNKAILSFKYDNLNCKINFVHISVIVVSTVITFIETLKSQFNLEETLWDVIPIVLASYITLSMAILRFLKLEETKEEISKCRENHVFIVNKFVKKIDQMENFHISKSNLDDWKNVVSNYESEIFDNYITIRAKFDTLLKYTDVIYYKQKYKTYYLKEKFINEDIELTRKYKNIPNNKYKKSICCCYKKEDIDEDDFFNDIEKGQLEKYLDGSGKTGSEDGVETQVNTGSEDGVETQVNTGLGNNNSKEQIQLNIIETTI